MLRRSSFSSTLRQRKPLPKVRERLRRNEGRVKHGRVHEKAGKTAAEQRHMDRVAAMGCLVSGKPATLHHVTASIHGGRIARSHKRVVPLAPEYHQIQFGPQTSVEALGHGGFFATYGIDLLAEADRLWAESVKLEAAR